MKRLAIFLMLLSSTSFFGCAQKVKTSDKQAAPAQKATQTQETVPAQDEDFTEGGSDYAEEGDYTEESEPAEESASGVEKIDPPGEVTDEVIDPDGESVDDEESETAQPAQSAENANSAENGTDVQ